MTENHHRHVDCVTDAPRRVLIVVANPTVSTNNNWPVGFWAAELVHPWYELTEAGFDVTIASPRGGKVEVDALSDPSDPSQWSAEDILSRGFLATPPSPRCWRTPLHSATSTSTTTRPCSSPAGSRPCSPSATTRRCRPRSARSTSRSGSSRPTATACRRWSTCGSPTGRCWSRAAPSPASATWRRDFGNAAAGVEIMPWRLEDALRERGAHYVSGGLFKAFTVRDGRLITGQQQYSGRAVAQAVLAALGA